MSGFSYRDQGLPTDPLQIQHISITPDPPKQGAVLKAVITATVQEEMTDGAYIDVTVKLGLIKLFSKTYNLFEKLKGDTSEGWSLTATPGVAGEPIKPGDIELTLTRDLKDVPHAKFTVQARAFTAADDDLAAIDFTVDLMAPPAG
ncbi:ML domain-containing protein [Streptomyces subrutilus]|uniref:MD-2-related lipid-recognition domain-containing protein n=1 Tax=Streptomyces subrutilus TaxID=36818 RepID=A0A1E5PKG3_9ACTN|nr:ML domain-containing protein [Streptomyces subrutilus]OEJ30056.1 hypothetical protein BGK67_00455 [Streptomyces subrutilus]